MRQAAALLALAVLLTGCWDRDTIAFKRTCRERVDATLLAPSTAEYGGELQRLPRQRGLVWHAHVDAQNAFGTPVRQEFVCILAGSGGVRVASPSEAQGVLMEELGLPLP